MERTTLYAFQLVFFSLDLDPEFFLSLQILSDKLSKAITDNEGESGAPCLVLLLIRKLVLSAPFGISFAVAKKGNILKLKEK